MLCNATINLKPNFAKRFRRTFSTILANAKKSFHVKRSKTYNEHSLVVQTVATLRFGSNFFSSSSSELSPRENTRYIRNRILNQSLYWYENHTVENAEKRLVFLTLLVIVFAWLWTKPPFPPVLAVDPLSPTPAEIVNVCPKHVEFGTLYELGWHW